MGPLYMAENTCKTVKKKGAHLLREDHPPRNSTWIPKIATSWWFFTNPFEQTYARQIGSFPKIGLKLKNIWGATNQFWTYPLVN